MVPHHSRSIETSSGPTDFTVIAKLLPYLWPTGQTALRARVVIALTFVLFAKIATVTVPLLYKEAVDRLSNDITTLILVPVGLILAYGGVRIIQVAFTQFQDAVVSRVIERAVRQLQVKVFDHLQAQSLQFHLDRQTGALSRMIERGARAIDMLLTMVVLRTMPAMIEFLFVCGILWSLFGWTYALVTFISTAAYVIYTLSVTNWRVKFRRKMNMSDGDAHTKLIDALINYETVKYFGNEGREVARLDRSLQSYEDAAVRSKSSLALLNTGQGVIITLGASAVMLMAAFDVKAGAMTLGGFVAVNTYMLQLFIPLSFLGMLYREVKQSLIDLEQVFSLLGKTPDVMDNPDAKPLDQPKGQVTFDHVKFTYDKERTILNDVSFTVKPGERVAIVGSTGSGKSTIVRLLFRFFDVTDGQIRIDDQDIRTLTQHALRRAIAVVPQDTVLFNDTIFYNIAYGRLDASRPEILDAIDQAHLTEFVNKLPKGLDTSVGERGLKLSGGEKQRVGIARAILKQPKVMVFDEATSSLDMVTEKSILTAMKEVSRGRATIVIAHRLSTITDADKILVLDNGVLAEQGTHIQLLEKDGLYKRLWEAQKREAQEAPSLDFA